MAENKNGSGVDYIELDFPRFIGEVVERQDDINLNIYDKDPTADETIKHSLLTDLAEETNAKLAAWDYLGHDTIAGPGVILPRFAARELTDGINPIDHEDNSPTTTSSTTCSEGAYQGLFLFEESSPDIPDLSRLQLYHRILTMAQDIVTPNVEQYTRIYSSLPIDNPNIQIVRPGISNLPNERWLRSVVQPLYEPAGSDFKLASMEACYQRLIKARRSRIPMQKNLDWFYDQLNEGIGLAGRTMKFLTNGFLLYEGPGEEGEVVVTGSNLLVTGEVVGFSDMATYARDANSNVPYKIEGESQLALCLETIHKGKTCLAKVPVGSLIEPEESAA